MRKILSKLIEKRVIELIYSANFNLPKDKQKKLKALHDKELKGIAKSALAEICENFVVAAKEKLPLCQDTGTAMFFVEIGNEVLLEEPIIDILSKATKIAYSDFYLRKSVVMMPLFERENTGTNLPPVIHLEQTKGDKIKITFMPKGGGAENKSALKMLVPMEGEKGVIDFVLETIKNAGGAACPPFLIGVGVGGTFDTVAAIAKKAILRSIGKKNTNKKFAKLEDDICKQVEKLKIGAMGFGGKHFVQAVHVEYAPCHIASLPVAVNIQCHSARSASGII